jgi:hypothetical protein
MARTGIEEKDVFEAADRLIEAGKAPTLEAIREKLGTGSFATISAHLKKWREQKIQESPIPEPPEALATTLKQIWATAFRMASDEFDGARAVWEFERKNLATENDQMLSEIKKLEEVHLSEESKRREAEAKAEGALQNKEKLEAEVYELREKLAGVQAKLEANQDRLKETAARAERLENELASIAKAQARKP